MSASYKPVTWNRNKLAYDAFLVAGIVAYVFMYLRFAPQLSAAALAVDAPILRMRAFGSLAFLLLTVVLAIGPLTRLDSRFLPLLYNRRHFGVITAIVAATHAAFVFGWYFAYSPTPQLQALFIANTSFGQVAGFPFEFFGVFALLVLAVLAVTSHDFWLSFLTPPLWKALHMSVYAAYAAVVLHVALGALAEGRDPLLATLVGASIAFLCTLHLIAGRRERAIDRTGAADAGEAGWVRIGAVADVAEGRAIIGMAPGGERIAVFRTQDRLGAVANVCSHQNGPVGEGRIVQGLVTCPWHGYQYRLEDGCSPPPFRERIRKYHVMLRGAEIWVDPSPLPLGSTIEPVAIPGHLLAAPAKTGESPKENPRGNP